jgi:hypothetical protein
MLKYCEEKAQLRVANAGVARVHANVNAHAATRDGRARPDTSQ